MDAVFGQIFRRQEHQQPLWLRALAALGTGLLLLFLMSVVLDLGRVAWTGLQYLPPERQALVGRLGALAMGVLSLLARYAVWRHVLYLDPAMRDLATTPASPWQILRLGLRLRPLTQHAAPVVFWALFLYRWFHGAWLASLPVSAWPWVVPLSSMSAFAFALLMKALLDAVAIAGVLALAAAGTSAAAARLSGLGRAWQVIRYTLGLGLLFGSGALFLFALSPGLLASARRSSLGATAAVLLRELARDDNTAQRVLLWFPSVAWFDVLRCAVAGPSVLCGQSLWRCCVWMAAAGACTGLCLNRALSVPARAFWHGREDEPVPADAAEAKARSFDADGISGPLEAALLRRFGRMGRAVLRLVSANFEAGSVDAHLVRSLKALVVCVAGGWATMTVVPLVLEPLYFLYYRRPFHDPEGALRTAFAIAWVVGMGLYLLWIWGAFSILTGGQQDLSGVSAQPGAPKRFFQLSQTPPTRGDSRYPLTEIYAVGYSDAMLLPTGYMLISGVIVGLFVLLEGLLFGLPWDALAWTVAIGVPALAEGSFLAMLNMLSEHQDYRRSRLLTLFLGVFTVTCALIAVGTLVTLIVIVCHAAVENGQPWIGWLGALNVVLVFDVALYGVMRWIYVRRRFDAEKRDPQRVI